MAWSNGGMKPYLPLFIFPLLIYCLFCPQVLTVTHKIDTIPLSVHLRKSHLVALLSVQMQKLLKSHITHIIRLGFSGGSVVKNPPASPENTSLNCQKITWRMKQQPTPVFLTGKSMDRGVWQAIAHRVTESRTQLKQLNNN